MYKEGIQKENGVFVVGDVYGARITSYDPRVDKDLNRIFSTLEIAVEAKTLSPEKSSQARRIIEYADHERQERLLNSLIESDLSSKFDMGEKVISTTRDYLAQMGGGA